MKLEDQTWRKTVLSLDSSIEDVIRNLNEHSLKIAIIVNPSGKFYGTVSDGDVRRGLLKGLTLKSPIETIIKINPIIVSHTMPRDMVIDLMFVNKVQQIPILDQLGNVVGLHIWDEVLVNPVRPNAMVIMAGGIGKRLRPFTDGCPKPLIAVGGKPMLEHIIESAKSEGFQHFILSINYLGFMIQDYFGNGDKLNVRIDYLQEESPLGTAGALGLLDPSPEIPFIVTNGDVLTDIQYSDLLDFHIKHEAAATMAVRLYELHNPFGVVKTQEGEIIGFEEKPILKCHINAGVYALNSSSLNELGVNEYCDMPELFERLRAKKSRTLAYPMHEPWLDVGRPSDLQLALKQYDPKL